MRIIYLYIVKFISNLLAFYSHFKAKKIKIDPFNVPIIINNRNRYSHLLKLLKSLEIRGYKNIIIIDNNSTYEPLLDYYSKSPYRIIRLEKNLGFKSLENLPIYKELRKSYFVYTDSDLEIIDECPCDFMSYFIDKLKSYNNVQKIGFSLKIDDLPDCYLRKDEVVDWEKKFYSQELAKGLFLAPIDTTFALHKPYALISITGVFKMIRTDFPYQMRHLPWYDDSNSLTIEEKYYIQSVEIGTHWSKGIALSKHSYINKIYSIFKKYF
ncbi:hypothetical protein AX766_09430 [Flavobacterium covae]|uniref:glycosyltransferase n=1 Tax=Flavobacterium covae TaxID=2906076 RepID=UPI0007C1C496|nr:glycosyltransferase [Flavobacterium covae]AND64623.1 hypothetical protein AX766_09430 [Flavobacterium covae]